MDRSLRASASAAYFVSVVFLVMGGTVAARAQGTPECHEQAQGRPLLDGRLRATFPSESVLWLAFSPDGKVLAASSPIRLWDVETLKERPALNPDDDSHVYPIAFSPDSKTLATFHGVVHVGELRLWDVVTGRLRQTLRRDGGAWGMAFSPDGNTLAVYDWEGPTFARKEKSAEVVLWDLATGKIRTVLPASGNSIDFDQTGKRFATAGNRRDVHLWDMATGRTVGTLATGDASLSASHVVFSPDGSILAGGTSSEVVYVWNTGDRTRRAILHHGKGNDFARALAFSPDGQILAVGVSLSPPKDFDKDMSTPTRIVLWDATTFRERGTIAGPPGLIVRLAFSPDGRALAAGTLKSVVLYDVRNLPKTSP